MKTMKIMSLILAMAMALAMFAGCGKTAEPVVVELTVDTESIEMTVGDTLTLAYTVAPEDTEVVFATGDNAIAMVDATGKVVALTTGETEIIVTVVSPDGDEDLSVVTVALTVAEPEVEIDEPIITLTEPGATIEVGATFVIEYSLENAGGLEVTYESMDETIATVDENGVVTAVASGEVGIIVTVGEVSETVIVTVPEQPSTVVESTPSTAAPASSAPSTAQTTNTSSASSAPNASTSSAPATSASKNANATKFFATTKFVVYESSTSAVNFGQSANGTAFYNSSGKVVAEITSGTVTYTGTGYEQSAQGLLDAVNDYRGTTRATYNANATASGGSSSGGGSTSTPSAPVTTNVDTGAYAQEVIRLINSKRADVGLYELEVDSGLMSHAQTRAAELEVSYSHTRPNGTQENSECIVMARTNPSSAFQSWMDSGAHRNAILNEDGRFNYNYIGVGCYQDSKGTLYWVATFSK